MIWLRKQSLKSKIEREATSVKGFEGSHPKLVEIVNSICLTLSEIEYERGDRDGRKIQSCSHSLDVDCHVPISSHHPDPVKEVKGGADVVLRGI
jgi:hypothetical protein